jgi:uncharacterized short protein YbdD (DUF466 family)
MRLAMRRFWALIREATGDDAYERYLAHWRTHHSEQSGTPLDRAAFCREEQRRRWDGVRRCC